MIYGEREKVLTALKGYTLTPWIVVGYFSLPDTCHAVGISFYFVLYTYVHMFINDINSILWSGAGPHWVNC